MARRLVSLLGGNQELQPLLKKVHEVNELQRNFISVAPPSLARYSQVLGLRSGTLTVAVANATIAAKLRQLAPELATLLQDRGCEISGIRVKVQVSYNRSQPVKSPRKLGKTALSALNELSRTLTDGSALKCALEKMTKPKD